MSRPAALQISKYLEKEIPRVLKTPKQNIPAAGGQELGVCPRERRTGVQWSMSQTEV